MRALALAAAALLACAAARAGEPAAQDPAACTTFDWSLLREQAWFSASGLPHVASGATLAAEMPGAVLALRPQAEVTPPVAPSRAPKPGTYGGVLHVPAPVAPGAYQITLSDKAWIDVTQDGQTTRPVIASTMRPGCPLLSKSVRFQLSAAPVTIVVSDSGTESLRIAIAPVE